jgi:hypothetical protein
MIPISYRSPELGDEHQMGGCMWSSANLWELTDGLPDSVMEWFKICSPEELRKRILSHEKTL